MTPTEEDAAVELLAAGRKVYDVANSLGLPRQDVKRLKWRIAKISRRQSACPLIEAPSLLEATRAAIKRGMRDWDWRPARTPQACCAAAGSPEKVAVLVARLEVGEELWTDEDGLRDLA